MLVPTAGRGHQQYSDHLFKKLQKATKSHLQMIPMLLMKFRSFATRIRDMYVFDEQVVCVATSADSIFPINVQVARITIRLYA